MDHLVPHTLDAAVASLVGLHAARYYVWAAPARHSDVLRAVDGWLRLHGWRGQSIEEAIEQAKAQGLEATSAAVTVLEETIETIEDQMAETLTLTSETGDASQLE